MSCRMVRVASLLTAVVLVLSLARRSETSLSSSIHKTLDSVGSGAERDTSSEIEGLRRRRENDEDQIKKHPWIVAKPPKDELSSACFLWKKYDTVSPYECQYIRTHDNEYTKDCKTFCNKWIVNLKTTFQLPDDCEYDDENGTPWCEKKIATTCKDCEDRMGNFYSKCCGSCVRKKCTPSQPPH